MRLLIQISYVSHGCIPDGVNYCRGLRTPVSMRQAWFGFKYGKRCSTHMMKRELCLVLVNSTDESHSLLSYLFKWLTFQQSGRYVNMSRSDPEKVTVSNFGTQRFLVLPGTGTHCICVSLILVNSCSLVYGRPIGETRNKKIGGVLHIQEHERLASHFCMQYDLVSDLNANAYGWVLYFNTRNEDFGTKFKQSTTSVLLLVLYAHQHEFRFSRQRSQAHWSCTYISRLQFLFQVSWDGS